MKKSLLIVFIYLIFTVLTACVITNPLPDNGDVGGTPKGDAVYLLSINDTHGQFYEDGDLPGLENVAGLISELEDTNGEYIKIATGDIFQGTYISNIHYGLPLLEGLNAMDFDAFVIGNHEFDWGLDKIAAYADGNPANGEADFPFLAANIVYEGDKLSWTDDYVIVNNGGYKVGIIGIIGYGLETSIATDKVAGYQFLDPIPIVRDLSATLRTEQQCDLVVVATHGYSSYFNTEVSNFSESNFVDAVICAHTHQIINEFEMRADGYMMPIIQSASNNKSLGEIVFTFDNEYRLSEAILTQYSPSLYEPHADILTLIDKYSADIAAGERTVAYTPNDLYRKQLGMEMALAMKEKYNAEVAFINTGGVRAEIGVGPIKVKDIYQVFPFDNAVIVTEISGSQLELLYQEQSGYLYFNNDFNFYNINQDQTYRIATIDYVYYQNYYIEYFYEFPPILTGDMMRDVFIEYLETEN